MSESLGVSFRGRQFFGQVQLVPLGYHGVLLREEEDSIDEDEEDSRGDDKESEKTRLTWRERGLFSQFTYWQREEAPNAEDPVQRALTWLQLAHALHAPLNDAQLTVPQRYPRQGIVASPRRSPRKRALSEAGGELSSQSPRKRARIIESKQ
jgi:hypothetical protein